MAGMGETDLMLVAIMVPAAVALVVGLVRAFRPPRDS